MRNFFGKKIQWHLYTYYFFFLFKLLVFTNLMLFKTSFFFFRFIHLYNLPLQLINYFFLCVYVTLFFFLNILWDCWTTALCWNYFIGKWCNCCSWLCWFYFTEYMTLVISRWCWTTSNESKYTPVKQWRKEKINKIWSNDFISKYI